MLFEMKTVDLAQLIIILFVVLIQRSTLPGIPSSHAILCFTFYRGVKLHWRWWWKMGTIYYVSGWIRWYYNDQVLICVFFFVILDLSAKKMGTLVSINLLVIAQPTHSIVGRTKLVCVSGNTKDWWTEWALLEKKKLLVC